MRGDAPHVLQMKVPSGVRVEKPIYLTNLMRGLEDCDTRIELQIKIEEGGQASVVVTDRSAQDLPFSTVREISADVAKDASFSLLSFEELGKQSVSSNSIQILNRGRVSVGLFCLTGGISENRVSVELAEDGAQADLSGIVIASGKQQVKNEVSVTHRASHCTDRELFKQILDEEATGRFEGLVKVSSGVVGTDSRQISRNICLSRTARAFAQPQLIIDSDDVKCSHGATVGMLDEEALFYMQQRGIRRHEARLLLLSAFLSEVIDKVSVPSVRDNLHLMAEERLRGELDHCVSCSICKTQ